jgi:pimeloyl-ACP methyl ester carboxylesterase
VLDHDVPTWFTRALATPVATGMHLRPDGRRVAYRRWGDAGPRLLVLVHGGAAHSRWWDHMAPLLLDGATTVLAVDQAGHGDSDRRDRYDVDSWADDVVALATDPDIVGAHTGQPVLVGHSMGGLVSWAAAVRHGDRLAGVVVIDAPIGDRDPELTTPARSIKPHRPYPSKSEIVSRFRLLPEQDAVLPYVLAHVAETSVRPISDGWIWKHDPAVLHRPFSSVGLPDPGHCRLALLRAEQGIVAARTIQFLADGLGDAVTVVRLPGTAHHMMLDQPLVLAAALRVLVREWGLDRRSSVTG